VLEEDAFKVERRKAKGERSDLWVEEAAGGLEEEISTVIDRRYRDEEWIYVLEERSGAL
jgi:hypothetical protein